MADPLLQRCQLQLGDYLTKLAVATGSTRCRIRDERTQSRFVIRPVSCHNFKSEIWIPKSETRTKRCATTLKSVKKMYERRAPKQEPTEFLGWEPTDIDRTCKPIITPEIETLRTCLSNKMDTAGCEDEGRKAAESLVDRGVPKIGTGTYRYVFGLSDRCVMKIPRKMAGAFQNITERDTWERIRASRNKTAIRMFAPVIRADENGAFLIMARARHPAKLTPQWFAKTRDAGEKIKELVDCEDLHVDNFGMIGKKNRIVLYDYGFGCAPRWLR